MCCDFSNPTSDFSSDKQYRNRHPSIYTFKRLTKFVLEVSSQKKTSQIKKYLRLNCNTTEGRTKDKLLQKESERGHRYRKLESRQMVKSEGLEKAEISLATFRSLFLHRSSQSAKLGSLGLPTQALTLSSRGRQRGPAPAGAAAGRWLSRRTWR